MIGIIIGALLLVVLVRLTRRMDAIAAQMELDSKENILQHRITRRYVGKTLLEDRLLPLLGWKEPVKPEIVRQFEAKMKADYFGKD